MAGHSKWHNIQHRKKAQDAKRSKLFTKMIREITVAARLGGGDQEANPRLRLAVDKALSVNVPKDRIDKAIQRGSGTDESLDYEEFRLEGYGPGGAAIMVDCMTDNRNRTVNDVRHAFSKHSGKMGTDGCVAFMFRHRGTLLFEPGTEEDSVMEAAIEAGAEDVITHDDDSVEVVTEPEAFQTVREALTEQGLEPAHAEVTWRPDTTVTIGDEDGRKTLRLIEWLEDLDDTQSVYTNAAFLESAYEAG
jgi:YebC/PmpR family DNA-binding regulatory protein